MDEPISPETLASAPALLTPASRVPTQEQRVRFIQKLMEGLPRDKAARAAGSTGSRFRGLEIRDPEFATAVKEATAEGRVQHRERIRREVWERALDRSDPASAKLLILEAEASLPEYEHRRVRHSHVTGELELKAIPWIDVDKLDALAVEQPDKFDVFLEVLDLIRSERKPREVKPPTPLRALPPAS